MHLYLSLLARSLGLIHEEVQVQNLPSAALHQQPRRAAAQLHFLILPDLSASAKRAAVSSAAASSTDKPARNLEQKQQERKRALEKRPSNAERGGKRD